MSKNWYLRVQKLTKQENKSFVLLTKISCCVVVVVGFVVVVDLPLTTQKSFVQMLLSLQGRGEGTHRPSAKKNNV